MKLRFNNNFKYIIFTTLIFLFMQLLSSFNFLNRYYQGILTIMCINIILVVSLNIIAGFLGQLTLGHAGFMAIGAYFSAYITKLLSNTYFSFPIALFLGSLMAGIFGIVVALITLRLKGDYLAIITLAFAEVVRNILLNLDVVGGASGYVGIVKHTNFAYAYLIMFAVIILTISLIKSKSGRAILAIKEDEIAASASGVDVGNYKILAFVFSAFFAGLAGGLYAHYMGILEPKAFRLDKSVEILVMCVLGGMGNLKGSIIAAIILTLIPELLQGISSYRTLLYAVVLIVMMLAKNHLTLKGGAK